MNSERIILSRDKDKMFLPMNVEGNSYDERFFNTTKVLTLVALFVAWITVIAWLNSLEAATLVFKFICILLLLLVTVYSIRYIVFEENYFYKMYKKTLLYSNPTSDVFWNIASIKDTDLGSVVLFSDGRIGTVVKLKRGSIIGKDKDFIEEHYDSVSNFIKEIVSRGYKYVNLNIMERADNDDRLDKIGIKINSVENKNIRKLLELELGYLKNVTRNSLYESDYYLIYSDRLDKMDSLLRDTEEIIEFLLNGCFIGYEILDRREIIDLHKELIGVSYFDYNAASINTFREFQLGNKSALTIKKLYLANGSVIELENGDEDILRRVVTDLENSKELSINVLDRFNAIKSRGYGLRSGLNLDKNLDKSNKPNNSNSKTGKIKPAIENKGTKEIKDSKPDDFNKHIDELIESGVEISDDFEIDI